jgi:hypothetical protein
MRARVRLSFPSFSFLHERGRQRASARSVLFIALAYAIDRLWRLCAHAWRHCSVSSV